MATREQIIACARTYLGTPFQHQGRIKGRGLDCLGLPMCVASELGLPLPVYPLTYGPDTADDTVLWECRKHLIELGSFEQMRPGDIVCMRVPNASHLAIVTPLPPATGIIHAYSWSGAVVEHDMNAAWRRRLAAVFLFPGVEN